MRAKTGATGIFGLFFWRADVGFSNLIDKAAAQGFGNRFRLGVNMQFIVYAANIVAGRMNAYLEQVGRSLIGVALHEELEQTHLLRSQLFIKLLRRTGLLK